MTLRLKLSAEERRTLREIGTYHAHARILMRVQGMFRLRQSLTLQQVVDELKLHLDRVENSRQSRDEFGLFRLFEGKHTGRPKVSDEDKRQLGDLACDAGGTAGTLQPQWQRADHTGLSRNSIKEYLNSIAFGYKRCRFSLKDKLDNATFERAEDIVVSLKGMERAGQCDLLYFEESGFSPNPPLQYGWTLIGHPFCCD